jgi:hypothetical protein
MKYFNNHTIRDIYSEHLTETIGPNKINKHGVSFFGVIFGEKNYFYHEPKRAESNKMKKKTTKVIISTSSNGSWFALSSTQFGMETCGSKFVLFGVVSEGSSILEQIHELGVNTQEGNICSLRIRHTLILNDPFTNFSLNQINTLYSPDCIHLSNEKFISLSKVLNREGMEEQQRIYNA